MHKNHLTLLLVIILMGVLFSCSTSSKPEKKENSSVLLCVKIGEKYGFINEKGKIIIEPQFDNANLIFRENMCFAILGEKKGFIDNEGNIIIELEDSVNWVYPFKDGLAVILFENDRYNLIDKNGEYIFNEPKCNVECYIDKDGEETYIYIKNKNDSHINNVKRNQLRNFNIFDAQGNMIGESYEDIGCFSEGLCNIKLNNKYGLIDKSGKIVIDTIFDMAAAFTPDGIAYVRKDTVEYFIDKSGNKLFAFDKILTGFTYNRAAVLEKEKKYLIDKFGHKIVEVDADTIYSFSIQDSLATIIKNNQASKIDTTGKIVLSTKYKYVGSFINGVALVSKNEKWGLIDKNGNEIIKPSFSHLGRLSFECLGLIPDLQAVCLVNEIDNSAEFSYYDLKGNLIGKDLLASRLSFSNETLTRENFIKYFDLRLSDLDPIEGIYYVTIESYYQNRTNPNIVGINDSKSVFYAIAKDPQYGDFKVALIGSNNQWWFNKFIKIGESNKYAIVPNYQTGKYSSEGKFTLEDPYKFDFRLELGHNDSYNFFVTYEFEKDYPPVAEYEKIQKAEWTGSGFAIADGYIATNYHVASGAKNIRIKGIGGNFKKSYKAVVVANDKDNDISILKIVDKDYEGMGTIPYKIVKTIIDVGENIIVLGYPKVETMGEEIKVTEGIISSSTGFQGNRSMYQISAAVQPGNSGGPMFDDKGTVIGIVCAKHADAENANYAVKISNLFSLINSSNLGIKVADNKVNEKKVSNIVKKVKNYVYLIECNSR